MLSPHARRARAGSLALAAIVTLAGCAGSTTAQSTLPANPAANAATQARASAGSSFVYAGTVARSGSSGKATLSVEQTVTAGPATYRGRAVTEFKGVETATGNGSTTKTTFDDYVATVAATTRTGTDVELLASESSDSNGVAQTTAVGYGNGVFEQLPDVPQARWSNTAARTVSIVNSVAESSVDDNYHADGSYVENAVPVEGRTASSQSYPDGYATYQFPYDGGSSNSTVSFSPPAGG
jgi:hypothetical protein